MKAAQFALFLIMFSHLSAQEVRTLMQESVEWNKIKKQVRPLASDPTHTGDSSSSKPNNWHVNSEEGQLALKSTSFSSGLSYEGNTLGLYSATHQSSLVSTVSSNNIKLFQGFLQPRLDQNINPDSNLSFFPNPTSGLVNLETSIDFEEVEIQIFDLKGSLIASKKVVREEEIDLSFLLDGVYILSVYDLKNELLGGARLVIMK